MVSSEPGQDLEGEAEETLFPPCRNGNAGEREELEDEIEGANPLGVTEGATGAVDIGSEFGGFDDEAPDEVQSVIIFLTFVDGAELSAIVMTILAFPPLNPPSICQPRRESPRGSPLGSLERYPSLGKRTPSPGIHAPP